MSNCWLIRQDWRRDSVRLYQGDEVQGQTALWNGVSERQKTKQQRSEWLVLRCTPQCDVISAAQVLSLSFFSSVSESQDACAPMESQIQTALHEGECWIRLKSYDIRLYAILICLNSGFIFYLLSRTDVLFELRRCLGDILDVGQKKEEDDRENSVNTRFIYLLQISEFSSQGDRNWPDLHALEK